MRISEKYPLDLTDGDVHVRFRLIESLLDCFVHHALPQHPISEKEKRTLPFAGFNFCALGVSIRWIMKLLSFPQLGISTCLSMVYSPFRIAYYDEYGVRPKGNSGTGSFLPLDSALFQRGSL